MPIISKETWDKFTQEEKEKIRKEFALLKETEGEDLLHRVAELMVLFPEEALHPQPLTYEDVEKKLKETEGGKEWIGTYFADKVNAIVMLLEVAKFLNKDWKPDEADGKLWAIGIEKYNKTIMPVEVGAYDFRTEIVYFRTDQLAQQAIQILGEDTVRLALTTEY